MFLLLSINVLNLYRQVEQSVTRVDADMVPAEFRKELLAAGAMSRRWAPPTRYTLWRNTAYVTKDLMFLYSLPVIIHNVVRYW